jgi:hypothetical protein
MPAQVPTHLLEQLDPILRALLEPLIENVQTLTGTRPGVEPIAQLPPGASAGEVLQKVNEVINRNQS